MLTVRSGSQMARKGLAALFGAAVIAFVLAGCGGSPTPTSTPTATQPSSQGEPTQEADPFEAEWEALIEAAQEEGQLVAVVGSGGEDIVPVYDIFAEKFGIEITMSRGSGSEQANRLLAEQSAGRYTADIVAAGDTSSHIRMIPHGIVQPIKPLLFHPEVVDESLWHGDKLWFSDVEQQYRIVYAAEISTGDVPVWFNTDLMPVEEILQFEDPWELLDDRFKGKIISRDPMQGGAGGYINYYLNPGLGPEWMSRLVSPELDVFFSNDELYLTDSIAFGRYPMGILMGSNDLRDVRDAGGPVAELEDIQREHGGPHLAPFELLDSCSGASGTMMVGTNAPHPNATKLWLNWFLSREGQTLMHQQATPGRPGLLHCRVTMRDDVTDWGLTDPALRREIGKEYPTIRYDPSMAEQAEEVIFWYREQYEQSRG